jgi:hypothetical protein
MIGLMTIFFGPFLEIGPEAGYFYLCPSCFESLVEPYLDEEDLLDSLLLGRMAGGEAEAEDDAEPDTDAAEGAG